MRRKFKLHALAAVVLVLGFLVPTPAAGSASATVVTLWIGSPTMLIDTTRQPIDAEGTTPVIIESRTLVPIRAVIEAFGGVVEWDSRTRMVMIVLGDNVLDLWIGEPTASLNDRRLPIDAKNSRVVPIILSGRTMLPLRFVSESLGINVSWEPTAKMIKLTHPEDPLPAVPTAPLLVAPAEGSRLVNMLPVLTWQEDESIDASRVQILSASGVVVHTRADLAGSTYKLPAGTLADGTYTWQASVHNRGGWGPWSEPRSFILSTVAAPAAPVLQIPANMATLDPIAPVFTWEPVTDADRYRIRVLRSGNVVLAEDGLDQPTYEVPSDMPPMGSGQYSWQAAAHGVGGWGDWSAASTFSIPRPDNGTVLRRLSTFSGGRGRLIIQMGTGKDAIVKLVRQDSTQASITIYVQSESSATVTGIPDGVYRVLYATGEGYDARNTTFVLALKAAEFDEPVTYTTTSTTYSVWTITLYSSTNGNAATTPLPGDSFGGY